MKDKVTSINKSIEKWEVNKKKGSLSEAVDDCSIDGTYEYLKKQTKPKYIKIQKYSR